MYHLACGKLPEEGWMDTPHSVSDETLTRLLWKASDENAADLQIELQLAHKKFTDTWKKVIFEQAGSDTPREILAGYEAAIVMLNKITTTKAAVGVLRTLGCYSEGSVSLTKSHRSGNIPVQTTAVACKRKR